MPYAVRLCELAYIHFNDALFGPKALQRVIGKSPVLTNIPVQSDPIRQSFVPRTHHSHVLQPEMTHVP